MMMKVALALLCSLVAGSQGCSLDDIDPCITWDASASKDANLGKARVNARNTRARWARFAGQTHDGIADESTPMAIVNLANCKLACESKPMVASRTDPARFTTPANYECTSIARHQIEDKDFRETDSTTCYMSSDIKLTAGTTTNANVNYYEWQMWRSRSMYTLQGASTPDFDKRVANKADCLRRCRDAQSLNGKGGCTQILFHRIESVGSYADGPACKFWLKMETLESQPTAVVEETRVGYFPLYEDRILYVAVQGLFVTDTISRHSIKDNVADAATCKYICWVNKACRFVQYNARTRQCFAHTAPLKALAADLLDAASHVTVYEKISPKVVKN